MPLPNAARPLTPGPAPSLVTPAARSCARGVPSPPCCPRHGEEEVGCLFVPIHPSTVHRQRSDPSERANGAFFPPLGHRQSRGSPARSPPFFPNELCSPDAGPPPPAHLLELSSSRAVSRRTRVRPPRRAPPRPSPAAAPSPPAVSSRSRRPGRWGPSLRTRVGVGVVVGCVRSARAPAALPRRPRRGVARVTRPPLARRTDDGGGDGGALSRAGRRRRARSRRGRR